MFLATKSLVTHVTIEGPPAAAPLVLLHSLGTDLRVWDPQAAALSRSFRVIRPDMRGHGLSEVTPGPYSSSQLAGDVLALLDALEIRAAHIVGLSIGGLVAQAVAQAAPDRVMSLVLCDTALAFPPPEFWLERAALVRAHGTQAIADQVLSRWVTPEHLTSPEALGLRAMLLRTPAEGYAGSVEALAMADLTEGARRIRVPTLIVVGDRDPVSPISVAETLRDAYDGELVIIEGAAHIPTLEKAAAVTLALSSFLRPPAEDSYKAGLTVRKEVLGEAHVARAIAATTELDRDFDAFMTRTAWGGVWTRPGLDRRTRSLLTLAILATLGQTEEFELHVRAALRNTGTTAAEISEMLHHMAIYAGIPSANRAMRLAKKVLEKDIG